MNEFIDRLMNLPPGYSSGWYNDTRYAARLEISTDKRRIKLFAEELGGNDVISFNLYLLKNNSPLLKPCEMTADKVVDFVLNYRPDQQE